MSIAKTKEAIEKLPHSVEVRGHAILSEKPSRFMIPIVRGVPIVLASDDLKSLAASHTRLLELSKDRKSDLEDLELTDSDLYQDEYQSLKAAIAEAEK